MDRRRALVVGLALALTAPPAQATEVWTSEEEDSALDISAFYKSFWTGLLLPEGLVDTTEALATAARGALPDGAREVRAVPRLGATVAHTSRLWSRLLLLDRVELHAAWQVGAVVATDPALVAGATLGSSVPIAALQGASRRLVDFDPVLAEEGGFLLQHNLDRLSAELRTSHLNLTVGRQVLSWGSGRLWNPTDLLSPFGPADVDREVRRGVDAVRASVPLGLTAQLEVLWLPQQRGVDQGAVVRAQSNVAGFDVAPSVAKYLRDAVFGFDVTGDIGPVGVHGEVAYTVALDRDARGERERFLRAVVGVDLMPVDDLVITGEYHYNGWGADSAAGYAAALADPRVVRGEIFGAGRHYAGLIGAWQATDLLSLQQILIANVQDPSFLAVPALEVWAAQPLLLRFGAYVPIGRAPDPSGAQRLSADDARTQSEAWRQAITTLGLRSEYGASPFGLFTQVVISLF